MTADTPDSNNPLSKNAPLPESHTSKTVDNQKKTAYSIKKTAILKKTTRIKNPAGKSIQNKAQQTPESAKQSPEKPTKKISRNIIAESNKKQKSVDIKPPLRKSPLKRKRTERSDILSKIFYQQARKQTFKRTIVRSVLLLVPIVILVICTAWLRQNTTQATQLIRSVQVGIHAIQNDRIDEGTAHLQYALDAYRQYHIENPRLWWQRDTQIFTAMFLCAQGWRSVGDYQRGLQTFEAIAWHNSAGPESWVGRQMDTELREFFDSSHWQEHDFQEMYSILKSTPASSWGECGHQFIQSLELVSLQIHPMKERIEQSDFVLYGTPQPMKTSSDEEMKIQTDRFYYLDSIENTMVLRITPQVDEDTRERFFWYSHANRKCLIFVNNPSVPAIDALEDIILSESYSVNEFNRNYHE